MTYKKDVVLVLGASGMLGSAVFRVFVESSIFETVGLVRARNAVQLFPQAIASHLICGLNVENLGGLASLFTKIRPQIVVNCIGLVKQLIDTNNPLDVLPINSLFPHYLANLCEVAQVRLIHISTDCVFSGAKGLYTECDVADANDLYGRSKYLGEVDYPNSVTLRTSIIGHELGAAHSLVAWFLSQEGSVNGFKRAIFSGLPTVEMARVIRDYVIPHPELHGTYHVSAEPINKFDLLTLIAQIYGKVIDIKPDDQLVIDRSLDSTRFRHATGFVPKSWPELIRSMHEFG